MNINDLKEIIAVFSSQNVDLLEFSGEGFDLKLEKAAMRTATSMPAPSTQSCGSSGGSGGFVTAPVAGTYVNTPPGEEIPYVGVGDSIYIGQTLCRIVDRNNLSAEVEADTDGVIIKILVDNNTPVDYGQVLMQVKED